MSRNEVVRLLNIAEKQNYIEFKPGLNNSKRCFIVKEKYEQLKENIEKKAA